MRNIFVSVCSAFALLGCASKAYVKTEAAPDSGVSKTSNFYILVMDSNSIEEQKALKALSDTLIENGYLVTEDIRESDLYFAITIDTPSYKSTYSMPITSPSSTNYSGTVGGQYYSGTSTSYETNYVPITSVNSYKKTYIGLYKYLNETEGSRLVWSGFSSIDANKYYQYRLQIMEALITQLGADYEGNVTLSKQ